MPHIQPELLKRKDGNKFQVVSKEQKRPLAVKDKPKAIQKAKEKVAGSKDSAKTSAAKAAMSKASPAKKVDFLKHPIFIS